MMNNDSPEGADLPQVPNSETRHDKNHEDRISQRADFQEPFSTTGIEEERDTSLPLGHTTLRTESRVACPSNFARVYYTLFQRSLKLETPHSLLLT